MGNLGRQQLNAKLAEAVRLREQSNFVEAERAFGRLLEQYPEEKAVLLAAGYFEWEHGSFSRAVGLFRKASELYPDSEIASMALFHTLWKSGYYDSAFAEARRFVSTHDCEEYDKLIRDLGNAAGDE